MVPWRFWGVQKSDIGLKWVNSPNTNAQTQWSTLNFLLMEQYYNIKEVFKNNSHCWTGDF